MNSNSTKIANDIMIANFMCGIVRKRPTYDKRADLIYWDYEKTDFIPNGSIYCPIDELKFDSDWNWIVKVILKITSLDETFTFVIKGIPEGDPISLAYESVVKYLIDHHYSNDLK